MQAVPLAPQSWQCWNCAWSRRWQPGCPCGYRADHSQALTCSPPPPIVSYRSPHSWKHHLESKINFAARSGRATRWPLPGGGRLTPREQRCPSPPSTPEALGAPVKRTEKKKKTQPKKRRVWVGKERGSCVWGWGPHLPVRRLRSSERRPRGEERAGGRREGPLAPPSRWPHGAAVGVGAAWRGAAGGHAPPYESSWGWWRWQRQAGVP